MILDVTPKAQVKTEKNKLDKILNFLLQKKDTHQSEHNLQNARHYFQIIYPEYIKNS